MKKRVIALFAVLSALALFVTACGGGGAAPTTAAPAAEATTAAPTTAATTTKAPETTTEAPAAEVPTLIWFMGDPGTPPPDEELVEAKLNEISVAKVGVKMKTIFYNDDNIKLNMNAGEPWDIAFTCEWYNNYAVQGHAGFFADITDKLKSVTPLLYDTMPEIVWEGAKIDGKIMAIPVKKDYAAEIFYRFNKELFIDSLGMDIPDKMSFFDIEKYLEVCKKAIADGNDKAKAEYPLMLTKSGFGALDSNFDMINRDAMMGIPYSAVGTPDEDKVVFEIECQDFLDRLYAVRKWYQEGYINMDAPALDSAPQAYDISPGQGFYGADAIWTGAVGYPIFISKYSGPYLSTASIRGSLNAINAKSDNIDLALKYQELVNTDQEYRDILRYGIEGTHWNRTPEGLVQRTDAGRNGYQPWPFSQGSYSLSSVEAAEGVTVDPNMWNVIFDSYKDAIATKTIGFSFDPVNVEAEIAAVKSAKEKYWAGLTTGSMDPVDTLPKFVAECEAAGIRKVLEDCQTQFDAFLASR